MQEQIAVDALDGTHIRRVALGTADAQEMLFARTHVVLLLAMLRDHLARSIESSDVRGDLAALFGRQVQTGRLVLSAAKRRRLSRTGVGKTKFVGTCRLNEVSKGRTLCQIGRAHV